MTFPVTECDDSETETLLKQPPRPETRIQVKSTQDLAHQASTGKAPLGVKMVLSLSNNSRTEELESGILERVPVSPQDSPEETLKSPSQEPSEGSSKSRTASLLLGAGSALGLMAAAVGLLMPSLSNKPAPSESIVAMVNGDAILRGEYERLLASFEQDSKNPMTDEIRTHILDRMIEEELLVQRALDLGLAQVDRRVRANLTSSLIDSVVSTAEDQDPDQDELRDFHRDQADFFTRPGRLRVAQILFRIDADQDEVSVYHRIEAAQAALKEGKSFSEVNREYGDSQISPVPDVLLPALKLREYVGPTALQTVLSLRPSEVSQPVRSGSGLSLFKLQEATPSVLPAFEDVEPQVRREWVRRAGDQALREYLDQLRDDGDVRIF